MITETEGIVLRQTKLPDGRRMLVLFTQKYGKISAGSSLTEKNRSKSALAVRPFCRGRYELFKGRDIFAVNSAETLESFYSIGEDIDKFMAASRILELTDAVLCEGEPQTALYKLLCDYLRMMAQRKSDFATPGTGFQLKALQLLGCGLTVKRCAVCGKPGSEGDLTLSAEDGGLLCKACAAGRKTPDPLIFTVSDDIIAIIGYILDHPFGNLERLSVSPKNTERLKAFLNTYMAHHLGVDRLRSDGLLP